MSGIRYDLEGSSDQLVSSLEDAIRELTRTMKAADDTMTAVKKLDDAQKKGGDSAKKHGEAFGGLTKILKSFGGDIAGVTDQAEEFGEGLEKMAGELGSAGVVAGTAGLSFAGFGLAVAGATGILVEIGRAAVEAGDKIGETSAEHEALKNRVAALDQATAHLVSTFGAQNVAVTDAINLVIGLATEADHLYELFIKIGDSGFGDTLNTIARGGLAGMTLGLSELVRLVAQFFMAVGEESAPAIANIGAIEKALDALKDKTKELADAEAKRRQGEKEAAQEVGKFLEEDAKHQEQIRKDTLAQRQREFDVWWGLVKENSKKEIAETENTEKRKVELWADGIDSNISATRKGFDELKKQTDEIVKKQEKDTAEFVAKWELAQKRLQASMWSIASNAQQSISMVLDDAASRWQAQVDAVDDKIDAQKQHIDDIKNDDDAMNDKLIAGEEEKLAGLEAQRKELADRAFRSQQQAAIGQATMAAAVAVMQAFGQLGPVAGALASGGIATLLATQIAIIQSQEPPAHDGGVMGADEFRFGGRRVRSGEAAVVFNQRAVEAGALDQAALMNRAAEAGSDREVRLVLADAGRVIGELVGRESRRPGSPLAAGPRVVSDPYGSNR